jgi:hypothetical protein
MDKKLIPYIIALGIIFIAAYSCTFNPKIDTNGDNCHYYMLATSIVDGRGYSDMMSGEYGPTNVFPPGYPLLMSPLRLLTDGVIPQKILNGIFLFVSVALLFLFVRKNNQPAALTFVAAALALVNYRSLEFATMMMSEMSFLFCTVIAIICLASTGDKPFWKDGRFYIAIIASAYSYHIRTQGIAFAAAIICWLLVSKKWKEMLAYTAGFALCLLPWILRNHFAGLGQSRYVDIIKMANPLRPEEGQLSPVDIAARFVDTFKMLVTKAIPNSTFPYLNVNYDAATTFGEWIVGLAICGLIGIGMWKMGRYKYLLIFYALATFGLISIFSTPSGNRYLTSILPIFEVCLIVGIYAALTLAVRKSGIAKSISPWILLIILLPAIPRLQTTRKYNSMPFPPAHQNYFKIAEEVRKQAPGAKVCSRKPELFYMFSRGLVGNYPFTTDDMEMIRSLYMAKFDYVVIDQLGYASTGRYLVPAIEKHAELFSVVMSLPNPDTWLLKFNRDKAAQLLGEP